MEIIYRGKFKSLKEQQRRWLKGRQAVEPAIGHLTHDMDRAGCWGPRDALQAVLGAVRGWLQHPLAAAGHRAPGLQGLLAPSFTLVTLVSWFATAPGARQIPVGRLAEVDG